MARNTFDVDETLEKEFNWSHYKRLGAYIKPYKKAVFKTLFVIILANLASMLGPYFTKIAIDQVIPQKNLSLLLILGAIFLFSLVIIGWCMRYRIYAITEIGQDILKDMRFSIFEHLQKLPFSYFDSRPHGKILIRVVNYINTLSDLLSNGLINLISDLFNVIITLIFMLFIDVKLTLYSLLLLPVLFVMVLFIQGKQRKAYQELSNKQSNLNAYIHESISGIKITQSFAREDENFQIFNEVSEEYRQSFMKAVRVQYLLWPAVQNISVITTCFIYFVGIRQLGVSVTTGTLIAFIGYINNFWNPVINIGNFYNSLITATAYLERIFETMDVVPEIQDAPHAIALPPIKGTVDFQHVYFRYEEGKNILTDVSFHIEPGQTIALVGPTGAGKTTIINLLSRFYDVNEGAVKIDGYDVRDVTLRSLRKQMGVMLQDTFIFSGTIIENIRYGNLAATEEEVIQAAKIVRAHDFIKDLKDGYETVVEERGSTLSAGQRQLISFARALLADPKILILDEATSSIDTKTEELLQEGLQQLLKGRTSFIIAHRLSTIKNSDKIFYIDGGRIVEEGSHDQLMAKHALYHHLYQSQYNLLKS
ncbi:ABC transporter ATP-binding protein/permease [Enterococcus faecalis]|uniref:ABC transporter ATP-binding protein n=1 Tax=Enterococcus faecalis TaxID=1351 RepID=UPI00201A39FC|nr:ABC transporter ATP-binding protein [Enterococcus faecalis]MCL4906744.1 ABC transporter ATP-binding protein/permease [Enterococcus faecalis]MCV3157138.1 ABC transporter ATP-binding protein/permease [Enterococcus faecalis]MCV3162539.1 ABC transporter ATP-binding protein/permease [Enterococcus faecalis]MDJ9038682.1 ABC transporter ATP-binding protein/permease [Enterococcus faecalis]MDK0490180.1 ABC transporter ATP-binding protein/permease [Enterococcus faecalis]